MGGESQAWSLVRDEAMIYYLEYVGRIVVMFEENNSFRQPRYAMARKLFCHKSDCHGLEAAEVEVSRLHCDSVLGQSELELEGDLVTRDVRHGGVALAAIFSRIYGFQFNLLHLAAGGPTCPEIDRHTITSICIHQIHVNVAFNP